MQEETSKSQPSQRTWVGYSVAASLLAIVLPIVFGLVMRSLPLNILGGALHVGYVVCIASLAALLGLGCISFLRTSGWRKLAPVIATILNGLVLVLFLNLYILYLSGADE